MRSTFTYGVRQNVIWVMDEGGMKSVTNDIDNVITDIMKRITVEGKKLIYRDSMGIWDEVIFSIKNGKVTGIQFKSIGEKEMDKALEELKKRNEKSSNTRSTN